MENKNKKISFIAKCNTFFSTIQYCFKFSWKISHSYLIMRLMGEILVAILPIMTAYLGKLILDLLVKIGESEHLLRKLILYFLLSFILQVVLSIVRKGLEYIQLVHDEILQKELTLMFMEKSISADLEVFDDAKYNDKLKKVFMDIGSVTQVLWGIVSIISAGISCISILFLLGNSNLYYSIIVLFAVIPSSIVSVKYTKKLYSLSVEQINGERKKGYFQGILTSREYAQQMRLFHAGQYIKNSYIAVWIQLFKEKKRIIRFRSIITGILECLPWIAIIGISIDICIKVIYKNATIGDYSLYTGFISQLWSSVFLLSNYIMQIYDNQLKIVNMKDIEKIQRKIEDNGENSLNEIKEIEFKHVNFTYPGTNRQILYDINFNIKQGEKIAFVGLNGSGKSTIIKLLLRFYDIKEGIIKINREDIKSYKLSDLRRAFSAYFQNDMNYAFSILDNLKISDLSIEGKEIMKSVRRAVYISNLEDIIKYAPEGFETKLSRFFSTDGIELSGGQNQMLALARTIYRKNSILILDEPSSNLDPEAEKQLFDRLKQYMDKKTTILISHRLSNVVLADRIIVMEKGRIIEMGTQKELIKNKKLYAKLFNYQREKYVQ